MPAKILIIDDDKFTRQVLRKILERDEQTAKFEPEILVASNGIEGIEVYERERPTLVIVDLFMPKMDGFAVCKKLREFAGPEELTIAVTSGVYKDAAISNQIENEYGGHFFAKPYQLKNIAGFAAGALASHLPPKPELAPTGSESQASSGDLASRNAATLLWDFLEQEATGRLVLRRGQVVRQIELFVGHPVSVTTNVREETLGEFLVSRSIIDRTAHRQAMATSASSKKRLGETLIEMGILTPQELLRELTAQTRLKLVHALRWQDGSWNFRSTAPRNDRSNALDCAEVIVTGLASTAQVDPPSLEIQQLRNNSLALSDRGLRMISLIGQLVSAAFAKGFQPGITFEQLGRLGVNRLELYTCLDVLHTCGGLKKDNSIGVPVHIGSEQSEPLHLSMLADSSELQAPRGELYASLFDQESISATQSGANPLASLASIDLWRVQRDALPETQPIEMPPEPTAGPQDASIEKADVDQDFDEDSVVNVTFSTIPSARPEPSAQSNLLTEFLRIQAKSLYEILQVPGDANNAAIEASHAALSTRFAKERFEADDLGRDYPKLNVLRAAYDQALETLGDPHARQLYDDSLFNTTGEMSNAPSLDAELAFREAEELFAANQFDQAIAKLETSVDTAPHEAAYRATLGWALFVRGQETPEAAELARPHLNQALALSPEGALGNEYIGRIHAALGDDLDSAIMHLGKALDDDPHRGSALIAIEKLLLGRGEFRALEIIYRRLVFRLVDTSADEESVIWSRLGDLHAHYMHDASSALIAYDRALKLSPQNTGLQAKLLELKSGDRSPYYADAGPLISAWKSEPASPGPLQTLFENAQKAEHNDGCFIAASALVAASQPNPEAEAWYQRHRPRFIVRAQQTMTAKLWGEILHQEDYALVGTLYALMEPILLSIAPPAGASEELAKAEVLKESALPADFLVVRNYVAHVLNVPAPEVRGRPDYERMISVTATDTPILLAGYDILACTNKLELCYRLARAMSYLRPGRATAAGSPARTLKSAMLACFALGSPRAKIPDPDGKLEAFKTALRQGDSQVATQLTELVARISQDHPTLNLSRWSRILARTADRVGLLLCGDLVLSARLATELGGESAAVEVLAFALSPQHLEIRRALGLSIDV